MEKVVIRKSGQFHNGASWSWQFGAGLSVYGQDGQLMRSVQIQGYTFESMDVARFLTDNPAKIDAEMAELEPEIQAVCEECARYQDEAVTAFEWQGFACAKQAIGDALKKHKLGSFKAFKTNTDKREAVLGVIVDEFCKKACENARHMMRECPDSAFRDYMDSQVIRDKARGIVLKVIA